jgi:hypothetical protein
MVNKPFFPQYGQTQTLATAAGAANANVPATPLQLLIVNMATGIVFVRVKPNGVAADASATDMPVAPNGGTRVISKDPNSSNVVSVFSPGGALGNVYVCPGDGWGGP